MKDSGTPSRSLSGLYGLESVDYINLGDIYNELEQNNLAKRMYRNVLRQKEGLYRSRAFVNLGFLYLQDKKVNQAMWMCWKAIQLNPFEINALVELSDLLHCGGKINHAIEILKEGLRYQPHNISLLYRIRELYKINKSYWNYLKTSISYLIYSNKRKRNRLYKILKKIK